ncbi:hypothetical protein RFI_13486 [Reticulomyxa filosa]|uniref:Transmembrane protein n=1 Tax=Reticulomyxa filosa TaxID=46433 RepID=X6NBL6_RETFI|nr:hypothetical protein RFI_13486 [Reticulomyxa filosa]|eukprot:ETO23695.1 hypothetical protein RFI_13486 [Reticulomyxa filosa]
MKKPMKPITKNPIDVATANFLNSLHTTKKCFQTHHQQKKKKHIYLLSQVLYICISCLSLLDIWAKACNFDCYQTQHQNNNQLTFYNRQQKILLQIFAILFIKKISTSRGKSKSCCLINIWKKFCDSKFLNYIYTYCKI